MAKFKNLITETGSFSFNGSRYQFNGIFETQDKELIEHFNDRNYWCEIEIKSKKVEVEVTKPKVKKSKVKKLKAEEVQEDSKAEEVQEDSKAE